jgi:hypothetical protein
MRFTYTSTPAPLASQIIPGIDDGVDALVEQIAVDQDRSHLRGTPRVGSGIPARRLRLPAATTTPDEQQRHQSHQRR